MAPESTNWAVLAADFIADRIDIANIVLVVLLFGFALVIRLAQKRSDFDFAEMLKDDAGRLSTLRFGIMVSLAVSSWIVMHDTLAATLSDQQMWAYLITWSGAAILRVLADRWDGHLPWTKHE